LRELVAPNVSIQILCIQYPNLDVQCELKSDLIHLLQKFYGLAGENPQKHLKEFHIVCTTMRPSIGTEEHIKLKAFFLSPCKMLLNTGYILPSTRVSY